MATGITLALFQAACGEVYDAITSEDWAGARKWYAKAEAQSAGLALQISDERRLVRYRETLAGLKAAIDAAEVGVGKAAGTYRTIKAITGFGR